MQTFSLLHWIQNHFPSIKLQKPSLQKLYETSHDSLKLHLGPCKIWHLPEKFEGQKLVSYEIQAYHCFHWIKNYFPSIKLPKPSLQRLYETSHNSWKLPLGPCEIWHWNDKSQGQKLFSYKIQVFNYFLWIQTHFPSIKLQKLSLQRLYETSNGSWNFHLGPSEI